MSTPFDGTWVGERDIPVDVTSEGDFVTLKYSDGEGPFTGFTGLLGRPVITVKGKPPHAGVLTEDGNRVLWSNNTVWNRTK
jgi:hypothetical protein